MYNPFFTYNLLPPLGIGVSESTVHRASHTSPHARRLDGNTCTLITPVNAQTALYFHRLPDSQSVFKYQIFLLGAPAPVPDPSKYLFYAFMLTYMRYHTIPYICDSAYHTIPYHTIHNAKTIHMG